MSAFASAAGRRSQRCRRPSPSIAPLAALAFSLLAAAPALAGTADDTFADGLPPLAETDLATFRGGFRIGGYDFTLGAVVKTVVAGAGGQLFELTSNFGVPEIGTLTHLGTTITPSGGGEAMAVPVTPLPPSASAAAIASATIPDGTLVKLPGTTILSQGLFNTLIENTAVDRIITMQTDVNLAISGLAKPAMRITAARLARQTADAQVQFLGR